MKAAGSDPKMATLTGILMLLATLFLPLATSCAPEASPPSGYYVAPGGSDANPGTETAPWATIQHAADVLRPGDTVYVRGGVYHETVEVNVSGSEESGYVVFRNYPGETPVLDGMGLDSSDGITALTIENRHHVTIQGLEIRNYTTAARYRTAIGILVTGSSHHIRLLDNDLHHIETHATPDDDLTGADAHGIAVYGTGTEPIHDIVLRGNHLHDLVLGSSEALVLNGNVERFSVEGNVIHDCDNIAIDAIGFEGVAPEPSLDRARDGVIARNVIYGIDSLHNPAYGGERSADGIYVDGGTGIVIERNLVHHADIGIEIASEHADGDSSFVTVRNNLLYENLTVGIAIGGYDEERGGAHHCFVLGNTLYHDDTDGEGNGEMLFQYHVHDTVVRDNVFSAGDQGVLLTGLDAGNHDNDVDYNLYFSPDGVEGSRWQWAGIWCTGFDAYGIASGNDARSLFVSPDFADVAGRDFHLGDVSPAIDAGKWSPECGEEDFDGGPRLRGAGVDMGACERK